MKPDPKDSCCKVMYCPDPSSVGHDTKQVGLSFDGCVHKKASYTKVWYGTNISIGVIHQTTLHK